ncbi:hypothetical protein DPMN_106766 [Dreissena polymorpha]|uniref:Uncharacterized protein n=1 Tax=Dreissena polymorpha TaxID=45954 RepID=A0A9D4K5T1_DREPO|nr:hypothetical protein DPMN_106766 [Dreissena polymorpha]
MKQAIYICISRCCSVDKQSLRDRKLDPLLITNLVTRMRRKIKVMCTMGFTTDRGSSLERGVSCILHNPDTQLYHEFWRR